MKFYSIPSQVLLWAIVFTSIPGQSQSLFSVEVKGNGKPMILIHGLYCSGEVWKETVEHYQREYQCHVLTLAGFGGNAPTLRDNFLEAVKDTIIAYAKNKKLNKPVLLGHSVGGYISLWAAASAPGQFSKVISVDGVPFLPAFQMPMATPESVKFMSAKLKESVYAPKDQQKFAAGLKQSLPVMISRPERIDQVFNMALKADFPTQGEVMYEMFTIDLRKKIAAIDCPVLLLGSWIAGKEYGATHESVLRLYQNQVEAIKNCEIEISDTAKHFIFYDDPQWFYEKLNRFLKK